MNEIQFLRDPSFEKGISVHGPSHEDGIVAHFPAESKPIWMLAQWGNYRYPLTQEINYTELIHGFVLETHSAQVTVRPDNNSYDLRLEMRSSAEYTGRMRKDGEDWCHLLVEQGGIMEHTVPLGKLKELRYQAELRLDYCDSHIPVGVFDARRHSCQVHQYFSVEDVVNDEFMWFGVTFFDNRYKNFPGYVWPDIGKADATGHIIVNFPQTCFTQGVPLERNWLKYDVDLLPLIHKAAEIAWGYQTFLKVDWNNTYITSTNVGWEMFHEFDGAVEIKDMQLIGSPE